MTLAEFLAGVIAKLDDASIDYMVTGSVVSSYYGEPRTTRDIDIVLRVHSGSLAAFFASFDRSAVYIDSPPTESDLYPGQMFSIIDLRAGWKVDLVVLKDRPFSSVEFSRRRAITVLGLETIAVSAEDLLLSKLEWSLAGGSSRQLDDARGIVKVQGEALDRSYLRQWAKALGLSEVLEQILGCACSALNVRP